MLDNASRRGAVDTGMPLMILAFVVIGGFMYWLTGQTAAERALKIVEDTVAVDDTDPGVTQVALGDLEVDPQPYLGTEVRVAGFGVASMLGTQGFWLATPSGNPFLVSMSEGVLVEGMTLSPGDTVTVVGRVSQMNDSTLNVWTGAATINDNDRIVAEFATFFMEAATVRVTGGGN